jgi:Domain of unknown function (DUF1992)
MDILAKIAEQKIREAIERGEFDDLPFHGKPIIPEDLSGVPEQLRMGYKIMKNAVVLPPEMQLKKETLTLQQLIHACEDDAEKKNLQKKLNAKMMQFNILMERRGRTSAYNRYEEQIIRRLS